jgi:hypothetical protein
MTHLTHVFPFLLFAACCASPLQQVWVVFIGGAASLFIATVLVENNAAWFPAISRANKFIANSKKQEQQVSTALELLYLLLG